MSQFEWVKPSRKQVMVWRWWWPDSPYCGYDGIIADGSVRSGKTITVAPAFVQWAMMSFNGYDFGMCGKTIGTLRSNVINTLKRQLERMGIDCEDHRTENVLVCRLGQKVNNFYLYGGKDERSQDTIQGKTLAGVYFDEVALMPKSFVEQAMARCSVEGAKFWFTCNPQGPSHWFKLEYIDLAESKSLFYLHFLMDDNPTLSKRVRERYERQFTGVFYQRAVLGLWVSAEGKIYTEFTDSNVIPLTEWRARDERGNLTHSIAKNVFLVTMGVDFGGNGSYHAFNLTGFTKGFKEAITLKDKRIKAGTPKELEEAFVRFVQEARAEYPQLHTVYCDSAEQVLIRGLMKASRDAKLPIQIANAEKKNIVDRIRFYCILQGQGRYFVLDNCKETIKAFSDAVWDPDVADDVRLDDGSTNIDTLDAQEYSTEPYMNTMVDLGK